MVAALAAGGLSLTMAHARAQDAGGHVVRGRFLAKAKEKLGLSDEQVAQIKAVLGADKDKLTGELTAFHEARIALRETIQKPGVSDDDVRAASAKVAAAEADLAVERSHLYGKISPVLSADQLAKVNEFQERVDDFVDGAIVGFGRRLAQ